MIDLTQAFSLLGFLGPIGWQELLILGVCTSPLILAAIILIVLTLTGVIGGKKQQ